ncbi:MAG: TIGR02221 family CRISPR-associated protein [Ignavibacteria bacterium]|jgi:CRISPR-associated Csx2 family protein|nr:TIGR02221 family CRISPR-associated protein [Ignavibacteria bacterium]MDH7527248.1 TIGR02221 family CRISPR-associated protein [Ignavibacteria bacterium]
MPRSFISILGTNNYLECRHSFNEIVTEVPVKYCQEDIIKIFCNDFTHDDEIRIFLTQDAELKNWYNDGHRDREKKIIPNIGLKERLEQIVSPGIIKPFRIKEGYSEEEIWEIFQTIFDTFQQGEEVIVDITHSFRSLPMLLITLLNFAKQVKNIKIKGIYYAAFEVLGPVYEVEKIKPEERIAPILDLTSFANLQDWTNATYDFINYGNVNKFRSLVTPDKKFKNKNEMLEEFFPRRVIDNINNLVENIALCRGKDLLNFDYEGLRSDILQLKDKKLPKPFYYLIDKILEQINSFNNNPNELVLSLSQWCLNFNLFQQAITLLQEFTITIILKNFNYDYAQKELRNVVSQSFRIHSENISEENWKEPASTNKEFVNNLLKDELFKSLSSDYNSLTDLRNDVNHAGFVEPRDVSRIKGKLETIIKSFESKLK